MAELHRQFDSILDVAITCDESDDSVLITAVTFYEDRAHITDSTGVSVKFTADAAAGTHECVFGEAVPPFTHLRITSTFQA